MRTDRRRFLAAVATAATVAFLSSPVLAQQVGKAVAEVPMLDPWVAPEVREKARATPYVATEGEALKAQVRAKLKRRFEAAAGPGGALTAQQARSAGLGAIADHFGAIDRARRGAVRFEDYERFLETRR